MNIFQRLESLKKWYDQNSSLFQSNLTLAKEEYDRLYKSEIQRYTSRSKELRQEKEERLTELKSISYDIWIEEQFQLMLSKLSLTRLDSDKKMLIDNFKRWIDATSRIDYEFRISSCEKEYNEKIVENMNRHDRYITILKETYQTWKTTEEEKFDQWLTSHPYYLELHELECRYDAIVDDDDFSFANVEYSYKPKQNFPKNKTIPDNWYRLQKVLDIKI